MSKNPKHIHPKKRQRVVKFHCKKQQKTKGCLRKGKNGWELTMGVSLMLRWGKGSVEETWTGARGAPMTPRRSLRSDLLYDDTEGARDSCPFIQCPKPDPIRFGSPFSVPSGSGPSMRGVSVSPRGRRLTDLATEESGLGVTGFECSFKPMLISYGWSTLAKHRDPDWSPYDLT